MTFEEWWGKHGNNSLLSSYNSKDVAKDAWDAARPRPLTEVEILGYWIDCGHPNPVKFAMAIQKKLWGEL